MRILLLNGPNLGRLGLRQPEIYGSTTLAQVVEAVRERAAARGSSLDAFQSNHEGALIDRLEQRDYDGVVINPGAFTHYSYALHDALVAAETPAIEIHISDIRTPRAVATGVGHPTCRDRHRDGQGLAGLPGGCGPTHRHRGGHTVIAPVAPGTGTRSTRPRRPGGGMAAIELSADTLTPVAAALRLGPAGVHPRERRGRRPLRPLLVRGRPRPDAHRRPGRGRGLGRRLPGAGALRRGRPAGGAAAGAAAARAMAPASRCPLSAGVGYRGLRRGRPLGAAAGAGGRPRRPAGGAVPHARRWSSRSTTWPRPRPSRPSTDEGADERLASVAAQLARARAGRGADASGRTPAQRPVRHVPPAADPAYEAGVAKLVEDIHAGEMLQVVPARRFTVPNRAPALTIYRALRRINPSPYLFAIDLGPGRSILGASPELLVRVRDGEVVTRPLAGTRPRSDDPVRDARAGGGPARRRRRSSPSTRCSSTWPATTSGGSPSRAASSGRCCTASSATRT